MRTQENRYNRERQRQDLALRFIQHEAARAPSARGRLTDDRIRKLYRACILDGEQAPVRHRGKSPQQTGYFVRSPEMRQETALLASVCYLLGVVPLSQIADASRSLPGMQRGESLCAAFETYRRLVPDSRISFEHAVFLVYALARADELRAASCADCTGDRDRTYHRSAACLDCESTTRLPDAR